MTERQQKLSTTALFSVAVSVVGLAVTLVIGIARIGAIYGAVSNEHQQIFREIKDLADKKCK
jgi:ribulose 1,5-bisphosphate synthetase/thiazole synthase